MGSTPGDLPARIRFSCGYLLARSLSGAVAMGAATLGLLHPEWAQDAPMIRFLPDIVLQMLLVGCFLLGLRWWYWCGAALFAGRDAIEFREGELVVRVDKQLRESRFRRITGSEVTVGLKSITLHHGSGSTLIWLKALNPEDAARLVAFAAKGNRSQAE